MLYFTSLSLRITVTKESVNTSSQKIPRAKFTKEGSLAHPTNVRIDEWSSKTMDKKLFGWKDYPKNLLFIVYFK